MCAGFFLHRHHPENRNNLHGSDTALPNLGKPGQCVSCHSSCQDDAASLRGELLGSCVWQSFLLEMCSKCLPCLRHWQHSREEYSLPCAWKLPLPCYIPRLLRPLVGSPQLCLSSPSLPFFISYVHISCGTAVLST